eukprot:TRINITY_DN54382_c0_g1_i1.p1 TRINITY_DN54382_c0_g1~~TRINITY_DN54382_c0_g1_i1.p1  ORF type:complete len:364 (-),score=73.57 TRINITY_DN54382_c0_g1_i1:260-1225(-)
MLRSLVGSEMCIRDRYQRRVRGQRTTMKRHSSGSACRCHSASHPSSPEMTHGVQGLVFGARWPQELALEIMDLLSHDDRLLVSSVSWLARRSALESMVYFFHGDDIACIPPRLQSLKLSGFRLFGLALSDKATVAPFEWEMVPPAVTRVRFGRAFSQRVDTLPPWLTHLSFSTRFNCRVDNLPSSITHLSFGYSFNQPVDDLPPRLTHLTFGAHFNQPTPNLPPTLKHLTFGHRFDQLIDRLPPNISQLTLGKEFNQPVDHLPPKIERLVFGHWFNRSLEHIPKARLRFLQLGQKFRQSLGQLGDGVMVCRGDEVAPASQF